MQPQSDPNCPLCKVISGEYPSKTIYEDDKILCALDINPATKGHVILIPKQHFAIMPVIPPDVFKHMSRVAIQVSKALRGRMMSNKNTIFVANGGVAGQQSSHFLMHIIPSDKLKNFEIESIEEKDDAVYEALKKNLTIMMMNHSKREQINLGFVETEYLVENDELIAKIPDRISAKGHIQINAKNKLNLASVEDFFYLASYSATASFEFLSAHGSNILINESDDELSAHVVPRFTGDGLNFMWSPNKFDDLVMDNLQKSISFGTVGLVLKDPEKKIKFDCLDSLDQIKPSVSTSSSSNIKQNLFDKI
ncbi:HIT domain-containing protein [Candidatus Woesearchaeota archaeon]|jgi:histidine triad (HIT) family protein|nr:HIT domain-containing protein [Candidatus Woesearchaeota archaeon]